MRIKLLFLILIFKSLFPDNSKLILYYSMDEIKNGFVKDLSGRGNDLEVGEKGKLVDGVIGKALYFDGKTSFKINTSTIADFKNGLTISIWIKFEDDKVRWIGFLKKDAATKQTIEEYKTDEPTAYRPFKGFNLGTDGSSQPIHINEAHFRFTVSDGIEREEIKVPIGKYTDIGKWTHLVVSYNPDPKDRGLRMYINGEMVCDRVMIVIPEDISNDSPFVLGKDLCYFKGVIEELRVYEKVLSDNEIFELYRIGKNEKDN